MELLQAKIVETSTTIILNYGAIGAMLVIFTIALAVIGRHYVKESARREEIHAAQLNKLLEQMEDDRREMVKVVVENSKVIRDFTASVEELRREIRSRKE